MARILSPAKKRLILAAARKLLIERSFRDVALDDVAKTAGVAKGTLFLYYRSKDDLVTSVYADLADQLGDALLALRSSDRGGRPLLEATVRTILDHFDRNRDFLSQFRYGKCPGAGARLNAILLRKFKENTGRIAAILRSCAKEGLVSRHDYSYSSFALVGLCRSAMVMKLVEGSSRPLVDDTGKVLGLLLRGVGNRP